MFPSDHDTSNSENAVHHFADWAAGHWVLWGALLVLALAATFVSTAMAQNWDQLEGLELGLGIACVIAALVLYPLSLYQLVRHFSNYRSGVVLIIAATLAVVMILLVGLDTGLAFRILAGMAAVYGLGLFAYDGLSRIASAIPTTVLGLLGMITLGAVVFGAYASDRR